MRLAPVLRLFLPVWILVSLAPAQAFDCTPIGTLPLTPTITYGVLGQDSVPGEPVCGNDYTGESFHVWEFTLNEPTNVVWFLATGGPDLGNPPDAELFVLANCDPNACVATFANETGATSDPVCIPAGTYSLVVTSSEPDPANNYGVAVAPAGPCEPVSTEDASFGTLKSRF